MFNTVFSKVSYFYDNFLQPAGNDIITVTDKQNKLRITPFHVYFDAEYKSKHVLIFINGVDTGIYMIIDEMGQCYFEYPMIVNTDENDFCSSNTNNEYKKDLSYNKTPLIEESIAKLTEMLILKKENEIYQFEKEQYDEETSYNKLRTILYQEREKRKNNIEFFSDTESDSRKSSTTEMELFEIRRKNLLKRAYAENFMMKLKIGGFYNSGTEKNTSPDKNTIFDFLNSENHHNFLDQSSDRLFSLFCSLLGWKIPKFGETNIHLADVFYSCCTLNDSSSGERSISHSCESLISEKYNAHENHEWCSKKSITVSFSLCGDKVFDTSFKEVFLSHLTKEFSYDSNFVIQIADKNDEYYMSIDLFLSLFFFLLNYNNHPDRNLRICHFHLKDPKVKESIFTFQKFRNYLKKKLGKDYKTYNKSLFPNDDDLSVLQHFITDERNQIDFKLEGIKKSVSVNLFNWSITDKIVISDIDGTITKSDVLGHIYDFMGKDWSHCGVAELFTKIKEQNYKYIYLTTRPISMYNRTKNMIKNIKQDDFIMPDGPCVLSPTSMIKSLMREMNNKGYIFKVQYLVEIRKCFKCDCMEKLNYSKEKKKSSRIENRCDYYKNRIDFKRNTINDDSVINCPNCGGYREIRENNNPLYSGFGNKLSDLISYTAVGMSRNRIFIINSNGKFNQKEDKISKMIINGSNIPNQRNEHSYVALNNFAVHIFPFVRGDQNAYYDYYYFRNMMQKREKKI